ncbi:MAG TPA: hypothetical protein VNQ79_19895 [Blastocatellia bacterium]|nr:hypothetical protein [Blastocatellia bacterium]
MLKRLPLCHTLIFTLLLTSLPQAQDLTIPDRSGLRRSRALRISAYEDDPFVRESAVRRMDPTRFSVDDDGRPSLSGPLAAILEEDFIYRKDATGEFKKFAWNPWPKMPASNMQGDFRFQDEERFPLFRQERDADGKVIIRDGLQVWTPNELRLGDTTAFEAANSVKDAGETWAGRSIGWGGNGRLDIEPHVFIDFNAFYSPSTRALFFGVVPYRLRGTTEIKIFETAASWDMVAHESGHALHNALKPNVDHTDQGFNTWGESFGDQTAMWASLRNQERRQRLLAGTQGDLNRSNALTRIGEAFAALIGSGTGIRDAFNDKKISDTTDEVHDCSLPLTGAAYKIFLRIYDDLKSESEAEEALRQAGDVMGFFLTRSTDYTPENRMTLEDVAKAWLKVDREYFGSRYYRTLVDEFTGREIFDANSVNEGLAHEAAIPHLRLPRRSTDEKIEQMIQASLDEPGLSPQFGLKVQGIIRDQRSRWGFIPSQTIVRVQLTQGRGADAAPLDNHGILVFRADGTLADYHSPLPHQGRASLMTEGFAQAQAAMLIAQASRFGLEQHARRSQSCSARTGA